MIEFQRTSLEMARRFLESQQNVMLAYLSGGQSSTEFNSSMFETISTIQPLHQMQAVTNEVQTYQQAYEPVVQYQQSVSPIVNSPALTVEAPTVVQPQVQISTAAVSAAVELPATLSATVAATAPAAVSSSAPASASALTPEQLIAALVDIVSERTGYPPEMLDPELDLEADLGIDSIKRVEILNSFRKLLPEGKQNVLEDGIERLAGVKTLSGIIDWIRTDLDPSKASGSTATDTTAAISSLSLAPSSNTVTAQMERELV